MNRRSFLAAVLGAMAAPALKGHLPNVPLPPILGTKPEWWRHYTVWGSATVMPGERLDEQLLPPPVPDDFLISRIFVNVSGGYASQAAVFRSVEFRMDCAGRPLLASSLSWLAPISPHGQLYSPYRLKSGSNLSLRLASLDPVECLEPVTVTVGLEGAVLQR